MNQKLRVVFPLLAALIAGLALYETIFVYNAIDQLGVLGVFLASMLSHMTVVGRDMFIPVFLPLAVTTHPLLLGASAAWGAALGLTTTYYWGKGISEALGAKGEMDPITSWIRRHGALAILVVASTPLPDTPVVLLAGSSRFPLVTLLVIEGCGKTVWYTISAVVGGSVFRGLSDVLGSLWTGILVILASTAFCLLTSTDRGRRILNRYVSRRR